MYSSIAVAALLGSPLAAAFPHIAEMVANQQAERRQDVGLPTGAVPFPVRPGSPAHALYSDFDPASQLVSTSGDHAWAAPTAGQIRGPCAGLNAAANHGYLPRSGIATTESVNTGLWQAYGLSLDATAVLQTATMFFDGDPLSGRWSIGYHSDETQSLGALGEALGNETGICAYGHLKTEADASITRGDWLAPEDNSNCASYPKFMQELFDLADEMEPLGDITPRVMAQHSANRKAYSIATNPNYFAPPYAGVAFTFGAHMFAFELLANHSAEHPTGFLTKENFMSFFSYSNATGSLVYTYGHERIPDNWYKRADADAWTANDIAISTAQQCASYPSNCQVGGNTGTVNSFAGVDPGDITGGFITAFTELSDPAKMGCFIRQNLQAEVPSFLDKFANAAVLGALQNAVTTQLIPSLAGLGECSGLPAGRSMFDSGSSYAKFPGAQNVGVAGARAPYRK